MSGRWPPEAPPRGTVSARELAGARERVAGALDRLGLAAYLFEVEPQPSGTWCLRIECALDGEGAWERVELPVPREALQGGAGGSRPLEELLRRRLGACLQRRSPGAAL